MIQHIIYPHTGAHIHAFGCICAWCAPVCHHPHWYTCGMCAHLAARAEAERAEAARARAAAAERQAAKARERAVAKARHKAAVKTLGGAR